MINWLTKRVSDPVTELSTEDYQKLKDDDNEKVNVVFHGEENDEGFANFKKVAQADDYNTYFNVKDAEPQGQVVMITPFGDDVTLEKADDGLKQWVSDNDRPLVLPFDDRTIGSVFQEGKDAILLYNSKSNKEFTANFNEAAQKQKEIDSGKLKFTEVNVRIYHNDLRNQVST